MSNPSDTISTHKEDPLLAVEEFKNALQVVLKYQKQHNAELKEKLPAKPEGWGSKSAAPFYNSKYAEELRPHLDQLYIVPNPTEHPDEIFFNKDTELFFGTHNFTSLKSGRIKLQNSWTWLIDNDDPYKIYRRLKDCLRIRNEPGGLTIRWTENISKARMLAKEHTLESSPIKSSVVDPIQKKSSKWKSELDDFITNAISGEVLKKSRQTFTTKDQEYIVGAVKDAGPAFHLMKLDETSFIVLFKES